MTRGTIDEIKQLQEALRAAKAEAQLARAEAQAAHQYFYNLMMQAPTLACVLRGPEHRLELINPPFRQLYGNRLFPIGYMARELWPELITSGLFEQLDHIYQTGESFIIQEFAAHIDRNNDGQLKNSYFTFICQAMRGTSGQVEGIIVNGFEVTEQVQTREILKTNQERFALAQQAAHIGTFEWLIPTGTLIWTPEEEALFGLAAGSFDGRQETWEAMVHPDDRAGTVAEAQRLIEAGGTLNIVYRVHWPDGSLHWLRSLGQMYLDKRGKPLRMIGISQDITEQYLAQAAMARSEAKFRSLFESAIVGTFVSTLDGLFLEANDALLEMLGYSREDLQAGKLQRDHLTVPEYAHTSQEAIHALREVGFAQPYEKVYLHKNGTHIPVLIAVARLNDPPDYCIGLMLDMSERKALEQRKDAIIDMTSHELKTPVTSLVGYTHLLHARLKEHPDPQIHFFLERMEAQLKKLTRLISDLLDLSKLQVGQLPYRIESLDLDLLLREIVEEAQATTTTHQIVLDGKIDAQVLGDRERLGQVLLNLLSNAIKYSPQAKQVCVRISQEHDDALISIQDFGIGIVESDQERIFERFYQSTDPLEQTYPGLGISLYLSQAIVQRHQGRLWVKSNKGEGSTFYVSLPLESRASQYYNRHRGG